MRERLWQVGFMLLLIAGFMLGGLVAQDTTPAKVIRAERFEVVNSQGRIVAVVGLDQEENSSLELRDRFGRNRVVAKIAADDRVTLKCLGSTGETIGVLPLPIGENKPSTTQAITYVGQPTSSSPTSNPASATTTNASTGSPLGLSVTKCGVFPNVVPKEIGSGRTVYQPVSYRVEGSVKNTAGKLYRHVAVDFNYYDDQGNQCGSDTASTENLEPGKTWRFSVRIPLPSRGWNTLKSMKVMNIRAE